MKTMDIIKMMKATKLRLSDNSRWMMFAALFIAQCTLFTGHTAAQNEEGDVTLQVTPVQSVLPPQAGKYIDNLGRYFTVTVINNTDVQQDLYFGVQIQQKFPDDVLWMSTNVETMHIPQQPIVLSPNQHKTLNSIELKHLFDHYDSHDIFVREGRYKNILNSEFGLLDEGQYEMQLTAYKWDPELSTPVVKNNQTDGLCLFNICYEAEPPCFTFPIREAVSDGLSDLSVTKIDKNLGQIKFDWTQPTLNCNATMVQFRYRIRFVELGSMMPDEAMEENTITFLEKRDLLTNSYTIPAAYLSQMIADTAALGKIYAMQVTAYTPYQSENSLNVALLKNEGKSDIFLFRLYDPTKEDDGYTLSLDGSDADLDAASLYTFEQPTLTKPIFQKKYARMIYFGEDLSAEWREAWFAGGKGERKDTINFEYSLQLFTGNSADKPEAIFAGKPVIEKKTKELDATIKWDELKEKVTKGDYFLLRVVANPLNGKDDVTMQGDSLNYVDFALSSHFDEDYQCGHENIEIANKTSITEVPDKNKSIKIGKFYLTFDGPEPVKFDKDKKTFSGKGWIRWNPKADNYFNMNSRVAVKFDDLKINTDYEVFEGRCVTYAYSDGKTEYTDAQAVDSLFSLASLDQIYGSLDLPEEVRNLVSKGVNEWGDDAEKSVQSLAKSYNLGKYYSAYKQAGAKWEDLKHGDVFDLYFPLELPDEISQFLPKSFSVQIGSMQFTPQSAQMNVIGEIALPNSDVFDGQDVLIFGAPRLCITPDKFWPEEGVLALLSNMPLKDPNTDFKMTFKAPAEPLDPTPGDGCFLRWDADGFAGLGIHIAMTMPNTKRVVDGKATDYPALLDLKANIEGGDDAMDFIATGTLTPFEATDLPGWTFHIADKVIFDYNMSRNDSLMPTIDQIKNSYAPMSYDEEKKKFVAKSENSTFDAKLCGAYVDDNNWGAWQGVYINDLEVEFPKFAVFGNGEQGTKIGASDMLIDASGITCRVYSEDILDAQTGKCGGWKFTIDKAYVDIIQNNFDNCTITGGFGVPLLGKAAQEKAGEESDKKGDKKDGDKKGGDKGASGDKGSDKGASAGKGGDKDGDKDKNEEEKPQETDIEYFCQIRHMTKPGTKTYKVYDKDGKATEKTRKQYDSNRLSYVFSTDNADKSKLAINFFLADLTLAPGQTYFLVESVDPEEEGGEQYTQVELCLAGDITIAGIDNTAGVKSDTEQSDFAKRAGEINNSLPLKLKLPGIHFAKMRLSNKAFDQWKNLGIDPYNHHQQGIDAQEAWENEHKKLYEFTSGDEIKLGDECYFNYGEWSLASPEKKIGPFTFALTKFTPALEGNKVTLDVEGKVGLMDGKLDVSAGIQIAAELHKEGSLTDWYLDDGDVNFRSIELDIDWEVFKFQGRLDIEDSETDKGYGGEINLEIKDLFKLDVAGGFFNHKGISDDDKDQKIEDAKLRALQELGDEGKYKTFYDESEDFYSWGYFLATVGGQGLRIDPIVINRITGGFYYNCRPAPGKKDKDGHYEVGDEKPKAAYGTIGVVFGIGITTSGGEETVQGDLDLAVIYDKKLQKMSHMEFNGEVKAVGGIIHSKVSLIYEDNDDDRFLCLNLTVTTGLDSDKLLGELTEFSNELAEVQEELKTFQSEVNGFLMPKPSTEEMKGKLDGMESDYKNKTGKTDEEKAEKEVKDSAKKGDGDKAKLSAGKTEVFFEFKVTFREKHKDMSPSKWHIYLGEPPKEKRCQFSVIDFKDELGIVTVKIGADAYLCVGNELPGNGQLPAIPAEITEFLNGHKNSALSTGADMDKVNRSRAQVIKKMLQSADGNGGVMLGASAEGFINVDLGLFYGYMKALGGFDVSVVKYADPQYCANYGHYMGKNGWYAMGQLYAYLAAKFGLHIQLGKLIDEKIDLVDAGIGGLFTVGLPSPTWIEGQARVKVSLLGGLVKIDKGFNFSAGSVCVPFKGNALDDFALFGDVSGASADINEGWDQANAISVNQARNMQMSTYAGLGERYRLYDPTEGSNMSDETGYSEDQMSLYASRTYIFDINKDRVIEENAKATINEMLGARLYEISMDDRVSQIYGSKRIPTGSDRAWVYCYEQFDEGRWDNAVMSRWMDGEDLSSKVKANYQGNDGSRRDEGLNNVFLWEGGTLGGADKRYNIGVSRELKPFLVNDGVKIVESKGRNFHLQLNNLKPGKMYVLELNGQAFEVKNGKRVWTKMTVTDNKGEKHSEYVRWEQKKCVFFCTKTEEQEQAAIPENLNDIQPYVALAYPSVGRNELFQAQKDTAEYKANIADLLCPTIALNTDIRSSFANGRLEWVLQGWSVRGTADFLTNAVKAQTITNKFVTDNGCLNMQPEKPFSLDNWKNNETRNAVFQLLLKYTYKVMAGTEKRVKGYDEEGELYADLYASGQWNVITDALKASGDYDKVKENLSSVGYDIDHPTDETLEILLFGIIFGIDDYYSSDFRNTIMQKAGAKTYEEIIYKDTTVYLANMWLKCIESPTWHAGSDGPRTYEKQFVGLRPLAEPTFSYTDNLLDNGKFVTDIDIVANDKKVGKTLVRVLDPWLYFAYLSKWVFINDIQLKKYAFDDVEVPFASESLTFSFNGHGIAGSLIEGANFRDKSLISLRREMIDTWKNDWLSATNGGIDYPLPLIADDDWGLTGNNQTFVSQPYDKFKVRTEFAHPYVGSAPFRYDNMTKVASLGAKYLLQQFTAPYYIAQNLSLQMKKVATQLNNIKQDIDQSSLSSSEKQKKLKNQIKAWQDLHRGQYLRVSSMGYEVQVPYYQFPLLFGHALGGDYSFSESIGGSEDDRNSLITYTRNHDNGRFYSLFGAGRYTWDEFNVQTALSTVKKFDFQAYRTNAYNLSSNRYEWLRGRGASTASYDNFQDGPISKSVVDATSGQYLNMYTAMNEIGHAPVYINGVPPKEGTASFGSFVQSNMMESWMQDNAPDLYAIYIERSNSKRIELLQQWASTEDPELKNWAANENRQLWHCLIWTDDPAILERWKVENKIQKMFNQSPIYPESEPRFSIDFFEHIISHKYGIIW